VTVSLSSLSKVLGMHQAAFLGAKEAILREVRAEVKTRGIAMAVMTAQSLSPPPVDRGTYIAGFRAADVPDGVKLFNIAPHAAIIEGGRRPGARMPPPALLAEWARRKGIAGAEARGIGFALAKAIAKRGMPARHVLRKTALKLLHHVTNAMVRAVRMQAKKGAAGTP
jgi:hypothetical protein